jgi:hypothetical protein
MHPYIEEALVRDRIATLRGVQAHARTANRIGPTRSQPRQRAGWFLVSVGLRLAGSSSPQPARSAG